MLVAKRSTSWQATPNNSAIATVLLMMKGVRRSRLMGMRSERWPNQARVNHNFHREQDSVQRFLNVLQPGTYV